MRPVAFMRLRKVKSLEDALRGWDPDDLVVQPKLDGWKVLAVRERNVIRMYTRRGQPISENFPKVRQDLLEFMSPGDSVLGEIVYYGPDGRQDIYKIQSVAGSDPDEAIRKSEELEEEGGKIVYKVYDILEHKGEIIADEPLIDRLLTLSEMQSVGSVQIVKTRPFTDADKMMAGSLAEGGEGLVIKPLQSQYEYGPAGGDEPSGEWMKFKPLQKAMLEDVIVMDYKLGKPDPDGYRKAIFPAYLKIDGELQLVGKLSGLDRDTERVVKRLVKAGNPVVIEIRYQEMTPSGKFRHMGFVRMRPDKPVPHTNQAT